MPLTDDGSSFFAPLGYSPSRCLLVAILLGSLIADEVLTVHMYIGSTAILISILLINKPWKQLKLLK
jgi:drug/metabolite transporter (DMT)-like permease